MGQRVNGVLLLNYSKVFRYAPSILRNDPAAEDWCAVLSIFPLNSLNLLNHSTVLVSHFLSPIAHCP